VSATQTLALLTWVRDDRGVRICCLLAILFSTLLSFAGDTPKTAPPGSDTPAATADRRDERPLPQISEVVKGLVESQQEVDAIRKNYIFMMDEDEQEPDGHNGLKIKHHNTYEVHYSGPWVVQTMVAQDGREFSQAEIDAERKENDKNLSRARAGMIKLESDPRAEGNGGLTLSGFLAADTFTNLRREMFHGHEALVLDFVPDPKFQPRRPVDKLLKNLSGKIWIDENDLHGIRLEAHVFNNVSYGGFLASVRKGTAVIFEQQKVNGEIWLPSYTELHFDARELFSTKHINLVHRFRDYKRFTVKSTVLPY
jgi:hypothetical protein